MDIFKPHKNAKTVIQRGLPKVLNQHIAEYWCFQKCIICKKHKHTNHFKGDLLRVGYINVCFDCRYVNLAWPERPNQHERVKSASNVLREVYTLPSWMTFGDADELYTWHDMKIAVIDILQFAYRHGIPPEYIDYENLWLLYS